MGHFIRIFLTSQLAHWETRRHEFIDLLDTILQENIPKPTTTDCALPPSEPCHAHIANDLSGRPKFDASEEADLEL